MKNKYFQEIPYISGALAILTLIYLFVLITLPTCPITSADIQITAYDEETWEGGTYYSITNEGFPITVERGENYTLYCRQYYVVECPNRTRLAMCNPEDIPDWCLWEETK